MRGGTKPNVVFILSDDQGPWAMGCAGNDEIITPSLDRIAETGIRFDNFFCTSPVCSPARASLLTGRMPSQHGVQDWIRSGNDGKEGIAYLASHVAYTEILADAGYTCGLSGKWHLGASDVPRKGMSHWYAHQKGSGHYYSPPMYRGSKFVQEPGYISDLITDDAIAFINEQCRAGTPFYCGVHYTAPHSPWGPNEHPREIQALYRDCAFASCPQEPHHPFAAFRFSPEVAHRCLVGYFSAVTAMDRNIGRILDTLEELGIREDTIVVFLSDNGFNCGHHGIWGKGNGTTVLNMYDTSVKVPAIVSQPGSIPTGRSCDALLSGYDFMPTLLDLLELHNPSGGPPDDDGSGGWSGAGGSRHGSRPLPGRSFAHLLRGERDAERESVVVYDEYGPVRMVRTKTMKYVHRYPYGPHELYDLIEDPDERRNRIDDPALRPRREELKSMLDEWFIRYVDPRRDASREPVTGNGQVGLSGVYARGAAAFDPTPRQVSTDPDYDPGMRQSE